MAKSMPAVVTFSGGEVDGYALARADLDIYPQTAEIMENVALITQGAMELFPGSLYIDNTPGNAYAKVRPWVFSQDVAFALELTAEQIRFLFEGGYVTLDGANATVGSFTDESAAPPSGGGPPLGEGSITVVGSDATWESPGSGSSVFAAGLGHDRRERRLCARRRDYDPDRGRAVKLRRGRTRVLLPKLGRDANHLHGEDHRYCR
jgi:hypothetical protein